ncbi:MAG: ABC transporter permease, partial [Planctomycetia bacterium]|nr:ABC transporter permease [Planctomycetia bacterium]
MDAADATPTSGSGGIDPADTTTVIRPVTGWPTLGLGDVWRHRELVWVFAARDVRVRYKQRVVGMGWA